MQRPTGVTILAVLNFVAAGLYLLLALGALGAGSSLTQRSDLRTQFGGVIVGVALASIVFAGLGLVLGIGFLKLRSWARILQIVLLCLFSTFQALAVMGALRHTGSGRVIFRLLILGIEVWVLLYLFKPHVKQAFGAAKPNEKLNAA